MTLKGRGSTHSVLLKANAVCPGARPAGYEKGKFAKQTLRETQFPPDDRILDALAVRLYECDFKESTKVDFKANYVRPGARDFSHRASIETKDLCC